MLNIKNNKYSKIINIKIFKHITLNITYMYIYNIKN